MNPAILSSLSLGLMLSFAQPVSAQTKEDRTVQESITVLNEIMSIPDTGIPLSMFKDSEAVAIIPKVIKGSFVIGARHGDGVLLVRDGTGNWHAPMFISLTGGNIGWQIGVQSTDVVLVFKTQKSVQGLLSGHFTLGADAAVAAGPVGRQAAAATDTRLGAEIYSYSRSRGLFAGVSFDGSVIKVNAMANASYYRPQTVGGSVVIPAAAQQLATQVIHYAETGNKQIQAFGQNPQLASTSNANPQMQPASSPPVQPTPHFTASPQVSSAPFQHQQALAAQHSKAEAEHVRDELAKLAPELYELLDPAWQRYLALPAEVFQGNGHPTKEQLSACIGRFAAVRTDPRYAALANHPEFQSTYGLLQHYALALTDSQPQLNLPAPPGMGQ